MGTSTGIAGDDTISDHVALGLTYPNLFGAAVLAGGYTHVRVSTNGWAMLTDGVTSTGLPATSSYGSTANTNAGLGGGAGGQPLLFPWWGDGNLYPDNSPVGTGHVPGVYVKASTGPGVPAEITWINHSDFGNSTTKKNFKALIYDSGAIEYQYSQSHVQTGASVRYVGVSARNGATPVPAVSDLSAGGITADKIMYETFTSATLDLQSLSILFIPDLILGGWTQAVICTGAGAGPAPAVARVGTGCYSIPGVNNAIYQQWTSVTPVTALSLASPDLTGNAMSCIATPSGYVVAWIPGGATTGSTAYVAPTGGAISLPTTDDGSHVVTTPAITSPVGVFTTVTVSHNGIITFGSSANATTFTVSGATFAGHTAGTGFYSWYDWNDAEAGSGLIKHEVVGGTLYITWEGVEAWQSPVVADPSTFQFQIDLATGSVNIVWLSVSTIGSPLRNFIAGFHGKGASADPGSMTLSTALPIIFTKPVETMSMSVDLPPGLGIAGQTFPMRWTVTNVPEATQIAPTVRACNIVFSIAPAFVGGYDVGSVITAVPSGCNGYLISADAFVDVSALNITGVCTSSPFVFSPPPSLIGAIITTQAIALAPAGVYAGFTNDIGGGNALWTSNAVQQTYQQL